MKYVALLRGINVGTSVRISMKNLKILFESNGYENVSTYINSGNIIFESRSGIKVIEDSINRFLRSAFNQDIRTLILEKAKVINIANAIPNDWQNDDSQKTDVAYLFDEINNKDIVNALPVKKEYIRLIYVDGALIWNVNRDDYNRSQLNKIISHPLYKQMTVRNVNTARYIASVL